MNAPDFWNDQKRAQNIIKETNFLKNLIASYVTTKDQLENCIETAEELKKSFDEELMMLLEEEYTETMKQFESFEINVLLSHPYDKNNAILTLHAGAGGTESCDWASMLCRMYQRYAERKGFLFEAVDISAYELPASVTGAFNDCTVPKNGDMWTKRDFKWESGAKVATHINKELGNGFWTVEMSIPWKNLGGKPQNNAQWLTTAARFEKDGREISGFQIIPTGIHDKQCFGKLKFTNKVPGVTVTGLPEFAPGPNGLKVVVSGDVPVELSCKTTFGTQMERSRQRIRKGAGELKFKLERTGDFKFSWGIAGSSNLKEYFTVYQFLANILALKKSDSLNFCFIHFACCVNWHNDKITLTNTNF